MLQRRRRAILLFLGLALLLAAAGCAGEEKRDADQCFYSFTDDAGRQVVLEEKPQKVAVLFSSCLLYTSTPPFYIFSEVSR